MNPLAIIAIVGSVLMAAVCVTVLVAVLTGPGKAKPRTTEDAFYEVDWPASKPPPKVWQRGDDLPMEAAAVLPPLPQAFRAAIAANVSLDLPEPAATVPVDSIDYLGNFADSAVVVLALQEMLASTLMNAPVDVDDVSFAVKSYKLALEPMQVAVDAVLAGGASPNRPLAYALKRVMRLPISRGLQSKLHGLASNSALLEELGRVFVRDGASTRALMANPDLTIELLWAALEPSLAGLTPAARLDTELRLLKVLPLESQAERWLPVLQSAEHMALVDTHTLLELNAVTMYVGEDRFWPLLVPRLAPYWALPAGLPYFKTTRPPVPTEAEMAALSADHVSPQGLLRNGYFLEVCNPSPATFLATPDSSDAFWQADPTASPLPANRKAILAEAVGALTQVMNSCSDPVAFYCSSSFIWPTARTHKDPSWRSSLLATLLQRLMLAPAVPNVASFAATSRANEYVPTQHIHPQTLAMLPFLQRANAVASAHVTIALPVGVFADEAWVEMQLSTMPAIAPLSVSQVTPAGEALGKDADCDAEWTFTPAETSQALQAFKALKRLRLQRAVRLYRQVMKLITRASTPINAAWYGKYFGSGVPLDPAAVTVSDVVNSSLPPFDAAIPVSIMSLWSPQQARRFCLFMNGTPFRGNAFTSSGARYSLALNRDDDRLSGSSQYGLPVPNWLSLPSAANMATVLSEIVDTDVLVDYGPNVGGLRDLTGP